MEVSNKNIWSILKTIKDPEIPFISIVDLGMINKIEIDNNNLTINLIPTFTACPAINYIENQIHSTLTEKTQLNVNVNVTFDPPWNSNMISEKGLKELKKFGIAPPKPHQNNVCFKLLQKIECPFCNGFETILKSAFGSTLCRSMHYCNSCNQSFEHFKPI